MIGQNAAFSGLGGRAVALHLLATGCTPILRLDTLTGLWRRGGADRQLARRLYELAGGDAA